MCVTCKAAASKDTIILPPVMLSMEFNDSKISLYSETNENRLANSIECPGMN